MISLVPSESWGFLKGDWSPFEAAPPEAGKSVSAETLAALSGCGLPPGNGVWGHAPPSAFGRAAASPQTRQMRCWLSSERTTNPLAVVRADDESLVPPQAAGLALSVARPLPTETASLGFGGSPVGGGDKNSRVIFFTFLCGGVSLTIRLLWLCRNNPARGLFQQKKRLSQSGCSAPTDELFPPAHSAFSAFLHGGGITTLGVRFMLLKRWTPAGHGGLFAVFMLPRRSPCVG